MLMTDAIPITVDRPKRPDRPYWLRDSTRDSHYLSLQRAIRENHGLQVDVTGGQQAERTSTGIPINWYRYTVTVRQILDSGQVREDPIRTLQISQYAPMDGLDALQEAWGMLSSEFSQVTHRSNF